MEKMRLNRFISQSGYCSRRKADELIEAGKVTVNGKKAVMGQAVSDADTVLVEGKAITHASKKLVYLAYHKPVGVICTSDPNAKDNIIDAVGYPEPIVHIGRLDVASSGLILLTNDGSIVNKILRSAGEHEKEYLVTLDKDITRQFLEAMRTGIVIDGKRTKPARASRHSPRKFVLVLTEGRNRQIRKMCESQGYTVKKLVRTRVMNIKLGSLGEDNWRPLTKQERRDLLAAL